MGHKITRMDAHLKYCMGVNLQREVVGAQTNTQWNLHCVVAYCLCRTWEGTWRIATFVYAGTRRGE